MGAGTWRSLVAHLTGGQGVVGSNPAVPTTDVVTTDRVLTIPNVLSFLRLLGVPVFLWLLLDRHADGAAIVLLMVSGWTDFFDGKIARRYGQVSRVGQLLDPLADRLYVVSTIVAFLIRDVLPLWVVAALLLRDVLLTGLLPVLRRHGYGPLPVHFMGKAATWNLLSAFPLLLLGAGVDPNAELWRAVGWAFLGWGTALYWWAGALYALQVRQLVAADRGPQPTGAAA